MDVDDDAPLGAHGCDRRQEPARERVGVDRERHAREALVGVVEPQCGGGIGLEQGDLARESQQHLARLGGAHRLGALDEHAPELLLERLDALAHRRRRHAQRCRGGVEGARVDDRAERGEVVSVEVHLK
ncbi:hypothetical protein GCM10025869_08090 [Homoserinibacter gongjuensis]|uniref:Uncharacterized protein n=1 Tax=Homoserinibacter gongjuensis TaxID=1162968 RepID=A0ABQ6JU95_9MICO|nr:hypothetical protein GCM10025869_08090 [Homoserinibacter gongjuensis]